MLVVEELEVAYDGDIPALRDVSLVADAGRATAVLGANGAGKTTLLRAISGTLRLHGGRVVSGDIAFNGQSLLKRSASQIVRSGVVQVPEAVKLADAFRKPNPKAAPDFLVNLGTAFAMGYAAVLEKAWDDKDLTRAGVMKAYREVTKVDTKGLAGDLDFSAVGQPSTKGAFILKPADVDGGLDVVQPLEVSKSAADYTAAK